MKSLAREKGFSLIEVLAGLAIMGLILGTAAQTLTWQSRIAVKGKLQIETSQAARTALSLIEKEVRQARSISSPRPGTLSITRTNNQIVGFYVDDKDFNGVKDLYQETDGVPTPAVSFIEEVSYLELNPGQWEITVLAREGGVENQCSLTVKRRAE